MTAAAPATTRLAVLPPTRPPGVETSAVAPSTPPRRQTTQRSSPPSKRQDVKATPTRPRPGASSAAPNSRTGRPPPPTQQVTPTATPAKRQDMRPTPPRPRPMASEGPTSDPSSSGSRPTAARPLVSYRQIGFSTSSQSAVLCRGAFI